MSRKSGKPPRKNPFLEESRDKLLDELNSIQDLLREDDGGEKTSAADTAPPLLEPEPDNDKGDAEQQIPLLDSDAGTRATPAASDRLHKALSERPNPFLSAAGKAADRKNRPAAAEQTTPTSGRDKQEPAPKPEKAPALNDEGEMRALVDEVLAAWMPKIERELRARLMEYLRER